jgi:hypothetical protein
MKFENIPNIWAILAGALFIFIYSWSKFNGWTGKEDLEYKDPPRHYTTWGRFISFAFLYTLVIEFFYMFIVFCPQGAVYIDQAIQGRGALAEIKNFGEYSFLWAVLIISGIIPNLKWIKEPELSLRHKLHEMAFIPFEAQSIIKQFLIRPELFQPQRKVIEDVIKEIGNGENYAIEDFIQPANSIRHNWCKLSYLRFKLVEWQMSRDVERFMCHCKLEENVFEKSYNNLKTDIEKYNHRLKELGENKPDEYILLLESDIREKLDRLLHQMYRVISCGVLAIEKLGYNRKTAFESFGLHPMLGTDVPFDWDSIINSTIAVFIVTLIPTLLYFFVIRIMELNPIYVPKGSMEALLWAVYSLVINCIGIVGAIFVKRQLSKVESSDKENIPKFHYLLAGLFGYVFSLVFLMIISLIIIPGGVKAAFRATALWPFVPATTAMFTIHYLHTSLQIKTSKWRQSLVQGFGTAIVGILVVFIHFNMIFSKEVLAFLIFTALTTWLIGASIGYTFPEGYRQRIKRLKLKTDRRIYSRTYLKEAGCLTLGQNENYECNIVDLSIGGASVDVTVPDPVGTRAELELPKIGKFPGWIVRKENKKTSLQLALSRDKADQLISAYGI